MLFVVPDRIVDYYHARACACSSAVLKFRSKRGTLHKGEVNVKRFSSLFLPLLLLLPRCPWKGSNQSRLQSKIQRTQDVRRLTLFCRFRSCERARRTSRRALYLLHAHPPPPWSRMPRLWNRLNFRLRWTTWMEVARAMSSLSRSTLVHTRHAS
jgi:hypothetical protein